jgi:hypothetical protein
LRNFTLPAWSASKLDLPEYMAYAMEAVFDFDNDHRLDRVLIRDQEKSYLDGTMLLVQRGSSSTELAVSDSLLGADSWFLPCQLSDTKYEILDCPPFSHAHDDAGFALRSKSYESPVWFRARYTSVLPLIYKGDAYLGVTGKSIGSENFAAVLKPTARRGARQMCLFRRVVENF